MLAAVQLALLFIPQHTKGAAPVVKTMCPNVIVACFFFNADNNAINMLYGDGALLLLEKCKNNAVEFDWVDGRRTVGGGGGC